jgi:hypothetical protein
MVELLWDGAYLPLATSTLALIRDGLRRPNLMQHCQVVNDVTSRAILAYTADAHLHTSWYKACPCYTSGPRLAILPVVF